MEAVTLYSTFSCLLLCQDGCQVSLWLAWYHTELVYRCLFSLQFFSVLPLICKFFNSIFLGSDGNISFHIRCQIISVIWLRKKRSTEQMRIRTSIGYTFPAMMSGISCQTWSHMNFQIILEKKESITARCNVSQKKYDQVSCQLIQVTIFFYIISSWEETTHIFVFMKKPFQEKMKLIERTQF